MNSQSMALTQTLPRRKYSLAMHIMGECVDAETNENFEDQTVQWPLSLLGSMKKMDALWRLTLTLISPHR